MKFVQNQLETCSPSHSFRESLCFLISSSTSFLSTVSFIVPDSTSPETKSYNKRFCPLSVAKGVCRMAMPDNNSAATQQLSKPASRRLPSLWMNTTSLREQPGQASTSTLLASWENILYSRYFDLCCCSSPLTETSMRHRSEACGSPDACNLGILHDTTVSPLISFTSVASLSDSFISLIRLIIFNKMMQERIIRDEIITNPYGGVMQERVVVDDIYVGRPMGGMGGAGRNTAYGAPVYMAEPVYGTYGGNAYMNTGMGGGYYPDNRNMLLMEEDVMLIRRRRRRNGFLGLFITMVMVSVFFTIFWFY